MEKKIELFHNIVGAYALYYARLEDIAVYERNGYINSYGRDIAYIDLQNELSMLSHGFSRIVFDSIYDSAYKFVIQNLVCTAL